MRVPTPKPSIGAPALEQIAQRVFVEVAAGEDHDAGEPAGIEDAPHPPRMLGEIAAVDAHPLDADAFARQPGRQRHHLVCRRLGVVGVDQQHDVVGMRAGEVLEGRRPRRRAPG